MSVAAVWEDEAMTEVIEFSSGDFVHLGLGATTVPLPRHTGELEWYVGYGHDYQHGDSCACCCGDYCGYGYGDYRGDYGCYYYAEWHD